MKRQPAILGTLAITVIMNAWAFPFQAILPVIARDVLGQGPTGLGMLGAASGVGGLAGLLLVNWGRERYSNEAIFAGGSVLGCVGLMGLSLSTSLPLSLTALVVSGVGLAGFSIMQSSIILVEATDEMRSRAMGALVLAIGSGPLGRVQGGAMAVAWGAPLAVGSMALWAALGVVAVAWGLRGFLPAFRGRSPR